MVDDYNNNMGGVDLADQRIAKYTPQFRCHRSWMPLCLHVFNVSRNNGYGIHKELTPESEAMTHKDFVLGMVKALRERADA